MRMTEKDATNIGIKVLNDIEWPFDEKEGASPIAHTLQEQYDMYKKFEGFEENKHKIFAYWTVLFDYPEDDGWQGRNIMRVLIKDETGEPYEIGHRQWKGKVIKQDNGKYKIEDY
jgi:hypothetical protein